MWVLSLSMGRGASSNQGLVLMSLKRDKAQYLDVITISSS